MTETNPTVAAVVVHYDSPESLRVTLNNLNQHFKNEQIVVIDNSSSLEGEGLEILATIVDDGKNRGYAGGVNRGFEYLLEHQPGVSEVLVCTHEAVLDSNALNEMLATAESFPGGHLVGPQLVTSDGFGGHKIWSNGGRLRPPFFYPKHNTDVSLAGVRTVDWVDGAAFLIDVNTWKRLSGVPEEFFMYMEDVAVGLKCKQIGVPVLVNLSARVHQTANGPSRALAIRNRILLARRYMGPVSSRVVETEIRLRQLLMRIHPSSRLRQKGLESQAAIREAAAIIRDLELKGRTNDQVIDASTKNPHRSS